MVNLSEEEIAVDKKLDEQSKQSKGQSRESAFSCRLQFSRRLRLPSPKAKY